MLNLLYVLIGLGILGLLVMIVYAKLKPTDNSTIVVAEKTALQLESMSDKDAVFSLQMPLRNIGEQDSAITDVLARPYLPQEQFPDASFPTVFINTPYFGNSASEIENLVSRPIEKEIQSITGLKSVKSTSMQDYSVITAEFSTDMEMDLAVRKVKDAVDKAKSELPTDLDEDPIVLEVNTAEIPIMTVNLSGNFTMDELREFAEYMEDEIENVDEVSNVVIKGAQEREVRIDVDLYKMQSLKVTFRDLENAIAMENLNMSAGEIINNDFRRAVRVMGQFKDVQEINDVIVKRQYEDRYHTVRVQMPCLVTALGEMNTPRYMTPGGIFDAYREKEVTVYIGILDMI